MRQLQHFFQRAHQPFEDHMFFMDSTTSESSLMSLAAQEIVTNFLNLKDRNQLWLDIKSQWKIAPPPFRREIFQFLFVSRQWGLFLRCYTISLNLRVTPLPWGQFTFVIASEKILLPEKIQQQIQMIFNKMGIPEELKLNHPQTPYILQNWQYSIDSNTPNPIDRKSILDQIKNIVSLPVDSLKKQSRQNNLNQMARAERIIQQASRKSNSSIDRRQHLKAQNFRRSQEANEILQHIENQADTYAKNFPHQVFDIALLFKQMDAPWIALKFIKLAPNNKSSTWLTIDLLTELKLFVELISFCEKMTDQYRGDSELLLYLTYTQALCLWELNQQKEAFELMNQITQINPNYKSSLAYLQEWSEEIF